MESNAGENGTSENSALGNPNKEVKNAKLKALLDGLELTPEQTRDDIAPPSSSRDSEILRDVPPHHG